MKKTIIFIILFMLLSSYCFSQAANVNITVEITNVVVNDGKVYLAIFANAESFRKEEPMLAFVLESNSTVVSQEVSLPAGDYVISGFQDANNNQKLDYRLLGIPRELVAISNYDGKGIPTKNFDRQKIPVNSATGKVTIGLYKF
jgi:uncharacterized protein (DUF2141 family)